MFKGMFWCQTLKGIGHLKRSISLIRELVKHFDVTFIQGGPRFPVEITSENFRLVSPPPILADDAKPKRVHPRTRAHLVQILQSRLKIYQGNTIDPYDFLITEFFPFEREFFTHEVISLIQMVKQKNSKCIIICSLRDIMDNVGSSRQREMTHNLMKYYDYLLVHSDPKIFSLEETFPLTHKFSNKVIYTGYVVEDKIIPRTDRSNKIVISIGGGTVGNELIMAVAKIAVFFSKYEFIFVLGFLTGETLRNELRRLQKFSFNIKILEFVEDFETLLSRCALSISQAGYNTVMNLIKTNTPAILYPYHNVSNEQIVRARKFENLGIFKMITESDLAPKILKKIIENELSKNEPSIKIDLNGAIHTSQILENILNNHN